MSDKCPHCGAIVHPGNSFCTSCGQAIEPAASEQAPPAHPVRPDKRPPRQEEDKKSRGCLSWFPTIITVCAIGLAVVAGLYAFLLRPRLEAYLLAQAEIVLADLGPRSRYTRGMDYVSVTESDLNRNVVIPDSLQGILQSANITLEQDRASFSFSVLGLTGQISGDASATAEGDILIHNVQTKGLAWMVFSPSSLQEEATRYLNQSFIRPANLRLRAVQITDEYAWIAYESR